MRLRSSLSAQSLSIVTFSISSYFFVASFAVISQAVTFTNAPAANLDLSQLGRVGLAGDFNGISLYQFEGQNKNGFSTNEGQFILGRYPNGGFAELTSADAGIQTMCSFVMEDGTMAGVVVGGNFTSLGGVQSPGAAMFNPNTSAIIPLSGLSGQVSALLCDEDTNTVYVGGSFKGLNSTNAIAWVGTAGWTNLPFAGFNGPVRSISKASNGNIVFGGSFTGLQNATGPQLPDQQIINISGATITAEGSSTAAGFGDARNIVCKNQGDVGPGNTWLLADNTPGSWKAEFGFGFQPTKLRLRNTRDNGRGTKTWRYTALPINGIMNFTYIDPSTGQNASCSSECPLSSDRTVNFQDFHFVNVIGMNAFQLDISAWYGSGGGLDGVELFQDDIFAYAINNFNEPTCAALQTASTATSTGPWKASPSLQSVSEYLSVTINAPDLPSIIFLPDIKQSGNYSVNIYTPGCIQDSSCPNRGRVNITGNVASGSGNNGFSTDIYQTNNFDKYDQIYFGYIEASSSSFRPSVTLTPSLGQSISNQTVVAQRVGFTLISSFGGLNNLFEYDPKQAVIDTSTFMNSSLAKAGTDLGSVSRVNVLQALGNTLYIGGKFSTGSYGNIVAVNNAGSTPLNSGGLNGEVLSIYLNDTTLYVGGNFTATSLNGSPALNGVAAYDTSRNSWAALGAGVDGIVTNVVPLMLNITAKNPEMVLAITGEFTQIWPFGNNNAVPVTGFAVWVPSRTNWLQNLDVATMALSGKLAVALELPGGGPLFGGSISSSQLRASGAVALSSALSTLPINIQSSQTLSTRNLSKRAISNQNVTGVVAGLFYESRGRNVTVLGGHFIALGPDRSTINNLAFINGSNSNAVTGLGSALSEDSTIRALALQGDILYAGGSLSSNINGVAGSGLISYNFSTAAFSTQPPALSGDVNAISTRPNSGDVYVGGSFTSAGSLGCPGVCVFTSSASQWNRPGANLRGVANAMIWASSNSLIVGGSLNVNDADAPLVNYDAKTQTWSSAAGASLIPGPVTAIAAGDRAATQLWIAGVAVNGSTFLMKYDGTNWNSIGSTLGLGTYIRGLQVLPLTKSHATSSLVPASQTLMITGSLNLPGFGNASAVLFNGTAFLPFALTTTDANTSGSISQIFSQEQNFFPRSRGRLAKGFIVLIALAVALGLIFLLVVAGVLAERIRRRREGYMLAPTASYDKHNGISRIPPHQLFSSLGQGRSGVEKASTRI